MRSTRAASHDDVLQPITGAAEGRSRPKVSLREGCRADEEAGAAIVRGDEPDAAAELEASVPATMRMNTPAVARSSSPICRDSSGVASLKPIRSSWDQHDFRFAATLPFGNSLPIDIGPMSVRLY